MFKRLKNNDLFLLFNYMELDQKKYLLFVIFGGIFSSLGMNLNSISLQSVVLAATKHDNRYFYSLIAMQIGSFLCFTFSAPFGLLFRNCVSKMVNRIRKKAFVKIENITMEHYENSLSGDMISRVTNDLNTFTPLFANQLPDVAFFIIFGVISLIFSLSINWWITIIITVLAAGFKGLNDYLSKAVKEYSKSSYEKSGKLVQEFIGILTGHTIIKMFGLEQRMMESYRSINQSYTDTSITLAFKKGLQFACNALLTSLLGNFTIVLGAFLVFRNIVPISTVLVINSLSWNISMLFRWTGQIFSEAITTSVAGMRIHELLNKEDEPLRLNIENYGTSKYEIEFKNVDFSYENKKILNKISFKIEKGKVIALVGESGGGKSTVMKLLLGFYNVKSGAIWVRKRSIGSYTLDELRQQFAYVSQESYLFDGSIKDNIRYGNTKATDEEIMAAAKAANAHDFILEQENGYETIVGERAIKLSGGQKQRIAIARAILKNAPILLLDEATSALDTESQEEVQKALSKLMENKTTIIIAHRLSTIELADEILVVKSGEIVENGTHKELLNLKNEYYMLHNM